MRAGPDRGEEALLDIRDLGVTIGEAEILADVSLTISPGRVLGVIGESGSGKSMTANAIMQLLPGGATATGRIDLDGENLLALSETEMTRIRGNRIGMVFQEPMTALNPLQTIGDQIAEPLRIHRNASRAEARAEARRLLDRVGLPSERFPLSRFPHELSGGQRQRVVVAIAIATKPDILIADEPTTALDVTTQAEILDLLLQLVREDGLGLMLITHDLAVVTDVADDLVIMREGRIVEAGKAATLYSEMRHPYTKALFAASGHAPDRAGGRAEKAPLLEVTNLIRDYPGPRESLFGPRTHVRAVNEVSFTIERGESLGLVGESGCGKSTLTRAILGLEPVQGGEIRIDGNPILEDGRVRRSARQKMQVVFQDPYGSFNPRHRVARLITEPFHLLDAPPTGEARTAAITEALSSVGIEPEAASRYIHEFSGGQRQRIAIARALIIKPDLIILDEAVSALDVSIRAQILDLLADLSARFGLAYLFISHDLSVVRNITDRVLVMKDGRIIEEGPTEAIFEAPSHPYTEALINAAPRLPESAALAG